MILVVYRSCGTFSLSLLFFGNAKTNNPSPMFRMAMAPVAYTIWSKFLRFDPQDPIWPNRDRFVLSMGHASMLLYSTLHLAGVKEVAGNYTIGDRDAVTMQDIQSFRQLHSRCAGHPEYVLIDRLMHITCAFSCTSMMV